MSLFFFLCFLTSLIRSGVVLASPGETIYAGQQVYVETILQVLMQIYKLNYTQTKNLEKALFSFFVVVAVEYYRRANIN